jgi:hypothetical protein
MASLFKAPKAAIWVLLYAQTKKKKTMDKILRSVLVERIRDSFDGQDVQKPIAIWRGCILR